MVKGYTPQKIAPFNVSDSSLYLMSLCDAKQKKRTKTIIEFVTTLGLTKTCPILVTSWIKYSEYIPDKNLG